MGSLDGRCLFGGFLRGLVRQPTQQELVFDLYDRRQRQLSSERSDRHHWPTVVAATSSPSRTGTRIGCTSHWLNRVWVGMTQPFKKGSLAFARLPRRPRRANYFCCAGLSVFGLLSPWFCWGAGLVSLGETVFGASLEPCCWLVMVFTFEIT
jgi:hypothetical protein